MSFFLRKLHTLEANFNNWFLESVKIKGYWNKDKHVKCIKYIRVIALYTCFSQPLLMFCFQKELNVSHLKGFFLNGHRPNGFDHRLRIKTNTVKTNNWCQKCFVWMITLSVCSETKKLSNWSLDRNRWQIPKSEQFEQFNLTKRTIQLKSTAQKLSFNWSHHDFTYTQNEKRFYVNSHTTWFPPQTWNVRAS